MSGNISLSKLLGELSGLTTGMSDPRWVRLALRVVDYCVSKRLLSPYPTVINERHLGAAAFAVWSSEEATQFFRESIRLPTNNDDDISVWADNDSLAFQSASAALLGAMFIISERDESSFQLYEVEDWDDKVVKPVVGKPGDVVVSVQRAIRRVLEGEGVAATAARANHMLSAYLACAIAEPAPQLLGQLGEDTFCLHRATVVPDASIPFPHIWKFLERLNDPEAFASWYWGCYSGLNRGRQIVYISDPSGVGGKSKLLSTLTNHLFGDRIAASYPTLKNDDHASASFIGKRMVVYGDSNNAYVIHSAAMKQLSGDDKVFVNPKFIQPFGTYLYCRVIIASNLEPFMKREPHNTSRTLWLTLQPLTGTDRDPDYGTKCIPEIPGFLAWARDCYAQRCPNHFEIQVNDAVRAATQVRIAECETMYSAQFDEFFVADTEGAINHRDWAKTMKEMRYDGHKAEDLLRWIKVVYGVNIEPAGGRSLGWSATGFRLRRGHEFHRTQTTTPPEPDDMVSGRH